MQPNHAMSNHAMPNHATLVRVNNPFAPYRDREVRHLACAGPIRAVAPRTSRPFIIQRNGISVLRRDWDQPVARGDVITVVILPQGGGGGGSNPLKIVLMLAVGGTMAAPGTRFGIQLGQESTVALEKKFGSVATKPAPSATRRWNSCSVGGGSVPLKPPTAITGAPLAS